MDIIKSWFMIKVKTNRKIITYIDWFGSVLTVWFQKECKSTLYYQISQTID